MSEALNLGNLLVGSGVSAVVVALIGAIFQRRMNQANYADALVKTSNEFTKRVDEANEKLSKKVDGLEKKVETLNDNIDELCDLLREAIPTLQASGHDALAERMRAAILRN
ncbi:hypothetical protein NONO_c60920 [Nocardia nova SH22a]|uniref:Uncharacterized protein n=1 Tax=Nocardia nova SH22a TaxID=1415166 RepID=W5TPN7_9NOCA|nr:hypothetical protein [Nocardia nova]AHH20868.1 hypothetical protein NONO_c60920 [Nocardia nova SH22a]